MRNQAPLQGWKEIIQPSRPSKTSRMKALHGSFSKLPPFIPCKTTLQDNSHFIMNVWTTLAFEMLLHFFDRGLIAFSKITLGGRSIELLSLIPVSPRVLTGESSDVSPLLQKGLVNHMRRTLYSNSCLSVRLQSWLHEEKNQWDKNSLTEWKACLKESALQGCILILYMLAAIWSMPETKTLQLKTCT